MSTEIKIEATASFFYIDKQGKRWNLSNVRRSELPGFFLVWSEGQTLQLNASDIQIERETILREETK